MEQNPSVLISTGVASEKIMFCYIKTLIGQQQVNGINYWCFGTLFIHFIY